MIRHVSWIAECLKFARNRENQQKVFDYLENPRWVSFLMAAGPFHNPLYNKRKKTEIVTNKKGILLQLFKTLKQWDNKTSSQMTWDSVPIFIENKGKYIPIFKLKHLTLYETPHVYKFTNYNLYCRLQKDRWPPKEMSEFVKDYQC